MEYFPIAKSHVIYFTWIFIFPAITQIFNYKSLLHSFRSRVMRTRALQMMRPTNLQPFNSRHDVVSKTHLHHLFQQRACSFQNTRRTRLGVIHEIQHRTAQSTQQLVARRGLCTIHFQAHYLFLFQLKSPFSFRFLNFNSISEFISK